MSGPRSRGGSPLSGGSFVVAIVVLSVLAVLAVALVRTGWERLTREPAGRSTSSNVPSIDGNPAHNRLAASTEAARRRAFTTMLSARACGQVTGTFYQGSRGGAAFWSMRCSNGRQWQVQLGPGGGTPVALDCGASDVTPPGCFPGF